MPPAAAAGPAAFAGIGVPPQHQEEEVIDVVGDFLRSVDELVEADGRATQARLSTGVKKKADSLCFDVKKQMEGHSSLPMRQHELAEMHKKVKAAEEAKEAAEEAK